MRDNDQILMEQAYRQVQTDTLGEGIYDYSKHLSHTPTSEGGHGGEYYSLDIPTGVAPPTEGSKLHLEGKEVIVVTVNTPEDMAKGRGGPSARRMRETGISHLVNCLPDGHKYLSDFKL